MNNFFYKYCPISDDSNLEGEYSLINLFNCQATYSTRRNFNDLFDSKVDVTTPTKKEVKKLISQIKGSKEKRRFKESFIQQYDLYVTQGIKEIKTNLDEMLMYCVTTDCENNLMWSHYASSHFGFCIEWDLVNTNIEKVYYDEKIQKLEYLEVIKHAAGIKSVDQYGNDGWTAFLLKLSEWSYEKEYRIHLYRADPKVVKDMDKFVLVQHDSSSLKSIIFGCRMKGSTRRYIIDRMPSNTKYKEVLVGKSSIEVVDYNPSAI